MELASFKDKSKVSLPLMLSMLAIAGCGNQKPNKDVNPDKDEPNIVYSDGMKIVSVPGKTIINLCRGNKFTEEVITANLYNGSPNPEIHTHSKGPDPKCADGIITPQDYSQSQKAETSTQAHI